MKPDPETMGAPASPYEACQDVLREWKDRADPAEIMALSIALYEAEAHRIRTHYAPMVRRVIENDTALQYDREKRN